MTRLRRSQAQRLAEEQRREEERRLKAEQDALEAERAERERAEREAAEEAARQASAQQETPAEDEPEEPVPEGITDEEKDQLWMEMLVCRCGGCRSRDAGMQRPVGCGFSDATERSICVGVGMGLCIRTRAPRGTRGCLPPAMAG